MGAWSWSAGTVLARPAARERSAVAVAVPAVVVGLAASMSVLHWLDRGAPVSTWWPGNLGLTAALGGFGALLVKRLPGNPIGWLMVVGGVGQGLMGLGREWAVYAAITRHGELPGAVWADWLGAWPFIVPIATFPAILVLFPDGRPLGRRSRWLLIGTGVLTAVVCVAVALAPGELTDQLPTMRNPVGVSWMPASPIVVVAQFGMLVAVVLSFGVLVARWRGGTPEVRQQLKWIAFAGALLALDMTYGLVPWPVPGGDTVWLTLAFLGLFLAAISMSVLRHRLWDIDALIDASIVYGALTVLLGGTYVAVVGLSGRMRSHPVDFGSSLFAAAIVAVAFAPLRAWLQQRLERRMHGDRGDPYRALTTVSDRLGESSQEDAALAEVASTIAASLRLDRVEIRVAGKAVAASGRERPPTDTVPLLFRGATVGELAVASRPGTALGQRERAVLGDMAPVLAAGVRAVMVSDELQSSRLRLVTAREEERRRVRRDLHDGLGPTLAALRMRLEGAALLIDRDPDAARDVLLELSDHAADAIADIRRLVHGLRPPALDELGLASAIAELAAAFSDPVDGQRNLDVGLEAGDGLDALPAAVEVAAFRIVSESLTNVVRHARATRCDVSLSMVTDGRALHVVVDDDGAGVDPTAARGIGVGSMIERAVELGGRCRLERSPLGGTRVDAVIPVQP